MNYSPASTPPPFLELFRDDDVDEAKRAMEEIVSGMNCEWNFSVLAAMDYVKLLVVMDTDMGKQCARIAPWYASGLALLKALGSSEHWVSMFFSEKIVDALLDVHDATASCDAHRLLIHAIAYVPDQERVFTVLNRAMQAMKRSARPHEIAHCMQIVVAIRRRNLCDFSSPVSDVLNWGLMNALKHDETRRLVPSLVLEFGDDSLFEEEVRKRAFVR